MAERALMTKISEAKRETPTSRMQKAKRTRSIKSSSLQAKLKIGQPNDVYEKEADRVADEVIRMPDSVLQRRCARCNQDEKKVLQAKELPGQASVTRNQDASPIAHEVLSSPGQPLDSTTRAFMEPRFGYDFSRVRVYSGGAAEQSALDMNARAYAVGYNIVFGAGQFAPKTYEGRRLIAHELTHVVHQQGCETIRRCIDPAKNDPLFDVLAKNIKATAAYKALADKTLADSIITDVKKKPDCIYYGGKLKQLFDTPEKDPKTISAETKGSTVQENAKEQARIAKPAEAKNLTVEETASADPARTWVKIVGKFGGGTYEVDRTDPKNIVVKAKVFLKPTGTGTADDVNNIKQMEDAIEKAASTKGFTVDIQFVNVPDTETFTAQVDPSRWEDAENWSGGSPRGFAHELMHMFAFELDRYNYIENQSTNQSMTVPNRLIWFAKQLTKQANFDNPFSIMGYGEHPLDDDVCRVAGLNVATCVAARQKPAKP